MGLLRAIRYRCDSGREEGVASYAAWRSNLRGAAGTSIGCLYALSLVLDLPTEALDDVVTSACARGEVLRNPDLSQAWNNFGVDDGEAIRDATSSLLARGGISADVTMGGLKRLFPLALTAVACDASTLAPFHINAASAPNMRVVDAVFASCALPCIFTPFRYGKRIFLDGGVVQNRPLCHGMGEEVLHCLLEDPERVA